MQKEFIPYEQALELKELGFDEPCFSYYKEKELKSGYCCNKSDTFCSAPLYQQAFRWFREKHNLMHLDVLVLEYKVPYEEAELACLKKLIEIVKNKENE